MVICLCHQISDRDIAREVAAGCPSFEALQDELRVATACGACRDGAPDAFLARRAAGGGCAGAASCGGTPALAAC